MKLQELIVEAKSAGDKRIKADKWPAGGVTYKGKKLSYDMDKDRMHTIGFIDGKEILRRGNTLGDRWSVIDALYDEVDSEGQSESAPTGPLSVKQMTERIKHFFGTSKANGWKFAHASAGDMMGKNKAKAFTIEYDKSIMADKEDTGKHMPNRHRFLIQGTFNSQESTGHDSVIIWLAQGGQIITVGIPPFKFKHGDFQSFEDAMKKAMAVQDKELIQTLYKSGYHSYGRA
jgi:hypothetical protein